MSRITNITVFEQNAYYAMVIRKSISFMTDFQEFFANSYTRIMDYITAKNTIVSGAPIVCFHNMDLEKLDVEVGFTIVTQFVLIPLAVLSAIRSLQREMLS